MEHNNSKPIILAMSEAENALINTVNHLMKENHLPYYLFEMIFDKVHRQLKDLSKGEFERVKSNYISTLNAPQSEGGDKPLEEHQTEN